MHQNQVATEGNNSGAAARLGITLGKALNDPVQLLRLLSAASGRLLTDDDVSVYVGMYEMPVCGSPNSAFDAHQAVLLQPHWCQFYCEEQKPLELF